MTDVRLLYISENAIDAAERSMLSQINDILVHSIERNSRDDVTGALVFDSRWFVQALEGELSQVWEAFGRISGDPRHRGVTFVEMKTVKNRLFANWWMGCAELTPKLAAVHAPYLQDGAFRPDQMTAEQLLLLMVTLAGAGYDRRLVG